MRSLYPALAALLCLIAISAMAQAPSLDSTTGARPGHEIGVGDSLPRSGKASNIGTSGSQSNVAPTLPAPGLGENAAIRDYLTAARVSLVAGRTGQAQQSLEMAETRALDRSVPQDQVVTPSGSQLVARIHDALAALGSGDIAHAISLIDLALAG